MNAKSFAYKSALIAVIAICTVLGVIGLVLPIIPGILFLGCAILLASKLSRRLANWVGRSPLFSRWTKHSHQFGGLSAVQRVKLAFWMGARYTISGLDTIMSRFSAPRQRH